MARNNYNFLLSSTFDFNPEDILNRSIQSYLKKKKNSKEKILDRIIEKMSKDGNYCIEHREGTKAFRLRKDKKQE